MRAREAAEALFAPKRPLADPLAMERPVPADSSAHKPRLLSIAAPPVTHDKPVPAVSPAPRLMPTASEPHVARIHTWMKYGMTARQVAQVMGMPEDEINRIVRERRRARRLAGKIRFIR
jgi:hypothetical protein